MTVGRPPKQPKGGGRTPPVHIIKPSGHNTSDLAKLQAQMRKDRPPSQVGGGNCRGRTDCPPRPPPDPNRFRNPNTKQRQEERKRIARRQVGGEFDGQYLSQNDKDRIFRERALKKQREQALHKQQQQQLNPPDTFGKIPKDDKFDTHRHSARCRDKRGNVLLDCLKRLNQEEGKGKSNLPF